MGHLSTSCLSCPRSQSYTKFIFSWANNCVANNQTNGVDQLSGSDHSQGLSRHHRAVVRDQPPEMALGLPDPYVPNLPPTNGSTGAIKTYILPSNKTGVVRATISAFPLITLIPTGRCLLALLTQIVVSSQLMSMLQSNSCKSLRSQTSLST